MGLEMNISMRKVNERIFRKFKSEIVRHNLKVGEALNEAMVCWLKHNATQKKKIRFADLRPLDFRIKTNAAKDVDEVLYGES